METGYAFATPAKQFPLRLEQTLAQAFAQAAEDMGMTKTEFASRAIQRYMNEVTTSGAREYLKGLSA
jgi:predicted DNA-binding protein